MGKEKKPKKNSLFKKIAIIATIAAGAVALTYNTVPDVKDKIDEFVEEYTTPEREKLEALPAVQNIQFDEENGIITFDEVDGAVEYYIEYSNLSVPGNGSYIMNSETGVYQVKLENEFRTGNIIKFGVVAKGDYINYKNSEKSVYEYKVLHTDKKLYSKVKELLIDGIFSNILKFYDGFKIYDLQIKSFDRVGDEIIVEGTGTSMTGKSVNFAMEFDYSKYSDRLPSDFSDIISFLELRKIMLDDNAKSCSVTHELSGSYHDLKDALEANGAFDEYIAQGYKVEILMFKNTNITREQGKAYFNYSATYRATHENKPSITFKQEHLIETEDIEKFTGINEFIEVIKEGQEIEIAELSEQVLNQEMNEELIKILNADTLEKNSTRSFGE